MSWIENRNRRSLFLSVVWLAGWCAAFSLASAQERVRTSTPAKSPAETAWQRFLRLPEGTSSDLKQQAQWLQQLQGLMAARALGSDTSASPKFDPEQLKALLNAMKQFSDLTPQGTVPPKSGSQPVDPFSQMFSDPAVQEQVRQMLKQFSQNGKLPPPTESSDPKSVQFPSDSISRSAGSTTDSPAMPPAVQELMKRWLQQSGHQPNGSRGESKFEDQPNKPVNPHRERIEPDAPVPPDEPRSSDASPRDPERGLTRPRIPGFRDNEPNPNVERARRDLEAIIREGGFEANLPPQAAETNPKPFDRATLENDTVDPGSRVAKPNKSPAENSLRERPNNSMRPKSVVAPESPGNGAKSPQMNVRSELQEKGFTQTLRKLIDQAREESRTEPNGSGGTTAEKQESSQGSFSGLEKSFGRLIDGLSKDAARETSQAPATSTAPMPAPTASPRQSAPPSAPEPRSTTGTVFNSIGNVFQEMAAAPDAKPKNAGPRQMAPAGGASGSQQLASESTGPLLMLLVALGLVWYFLPRVVTAVKESQLVRRFNSTGEVTSSAEIHTRADVVRAFHQYALQSVASVPDWWTHREVERQVANTTPALKPSIQVLASLYELARYLPDDAELTPDQIRIARRELENVRKIEPTQ